jgi:hypothetical protein
LSANSNVPLRRLSPWPFVLGALVGAGYGFLFRIWSGAKVPLFQHAMTGTMTFSFLALGSLCIGMLASYTVERDGRRNPFLWLLAPWPAVFLACALSVAFKLEGAICLIFALPGALFCSSIGGLIGGALARRRARRALVGCFALLPFLLAPVETMLTPPTETRTVASQIVIHAAAATVWKNIERVPAIAPGELRETWAQRIGFPRPIEATLSYEGVGGVRHASFERGVMFIETVTAWQPEHRLAFGINADAANIPPTTLDEHVTIGGRYFDVLDGEYRLEPLPNGDILLHLTSHQRLSTNFNGYAGLWTDAVMQNLQASILTVIQHRCEHS